MGIFTHHCQNIVDQTIGTDAALQNTIHALVPAIAGGGTAKEQTARYEVTQVQGQGYGNGNRATAVTAAILNTDIGVDFRRRLYAVIVAGIDTGLFDGIEVFAKGTAGAHRTSLAAIIEIGTGVFHGCP